MADSNFYLRFTRPKGVVPTHIPSWADPQMYYWGGRSAEYNEGEYQEVWHSSFRNPLPDHDIILFFNAEGKLIKQHRREGF